MAQFDLNSLYLKTFSAAPYANINAKARVEAAERYSNDERPLPVPVDTGLLGVPIHFPCTLNGERLPNEPLIHLTGNKTIIITPIDGNDGTFKEQYSTGDMEVIIQGICVDDEDPDEYPEDQVRNIRNIIELARHITIVNRLTSLWNIEYLAVMSYSFPAVPGEPGMQGYELRCLSDKDFNLRLREK